MGGQEEADWPTIVFYIFNSSWPQTLYIAKNGLEFTILLTHPEPWDYRCGPPHLVLYNAGTEPRLRARARQALSQPSARPPPPPPCNSLIVAVIYGVLPISK